MANAAKANQDTAEASAAPAALDAAGTSLADQTDRLATRIAQEFKKSTTQALRDEIVAVCNDVVKEDS